METNGKEFNFVNLQAFIVLLGIGATAGIFLPTFLTISDPAGGGNSESNNLPFGSTFMRLWTVMNLLLNYK